MKNKSLYFRCKDCNYTQAAYKFNIQQTIVEDDSTDSTDFITTIYCPKCGSLEIVNAINGAVPSIIFEN